MNCPKCGKPMIELEAEHLGQCARCCHEYAERYAAEIRAGLHPCSSDNRPPPIFKMNRTRGGRR